MDFMIQQSLKLVESGKLPDSVIRAGIRSLSKKRLAQEGRFDPALAARRYMDVLHMLKNSEIAIETDKANEQHYELPTAFFQAVLGKRLKYSASLFEHTHTTLDQAEEAALASYCQLLPACTVKRWTGYSGNWLWLGIVESVYGRALSQGSHYGGVEFLDPAPVYSGTGASEKTAEPDGDHLRRQCAATGTRVL